jgi:hypothetical protein
MLLINLLLIASVTLARTKELTPWSKTMLTILFCSANAILVTRSNVL